jgi:hypothetical protein
MQLSRALVLGFGLGFGLAVSSSCGPTPNACGPSTCLGCCDENGECLAGSSLLACGVGGAECVACAANQACLLGACGLIDGGDYDGHFPDRPDSSVNYDAGVFDASGQFDAGMDAGRPDSGIPDAGGMDAGRPDGGVDGGRPVSFMTDVQPIFDGHCNGCHNWTHSTVVNVSTNCGGVGSVYVAPNDLNASRLYGKIAGSPACGAPMPPMRPSLPQEDIARIAAWILQGAPNN